MADIAKELRAAMVGVTPGPWSLYEINKIPAIFHVHGPSTVVVGTDGICQPDRLNDRQFTEDEANMRYIAACSPDRITAVLDAIDAAHKRIATLEMALEPFVQAAEDADEIYPDARDIWEHHVAMNITIGDLRAARNARLSAPSRIDKEDRNG